jgi:hypothetical protein
MTVVQNPRGWKWFFAVLIVLTLAATVSLIVYNIKQQLTPEKFEAAYKRWQEKRPKSYTLVYKDKFTSQAGGDIQTNEYVVKVENRKVKEVLVNGIPKTERLEYHDMDGLFNFIERFFEMDAKGNRKVFRLGVFDPGTGALRKYVRRVAGSLERQEITAESLDVKERP